MFDKLAEDIEKRYWQKLAWVANKHNYTHGTSAKFSPASRPDKKPDYVSKSDSEYWISPMGVTRGSDHWGTVGSCDWKLGKNKFPKKKVYGFSPWENFEKKASALSDVDVSNWDNLSTDERNAIIKLMKPHTFAQLPGDRLGYGYEGSAYRGISPDFGEVTDDAPFNAIIKKFYGFEGEKPRFQARYDIAYNDPEVGKDPEFDKFLQRKFEKPEIKALIEAGEMAKAEKLLRKMESGTWRHGTRKYNILANPKNNAIMARVLKDAFQPSYETYIDGSHPKIKQIGGLVMERLNIPDMGSLDEGEFKMLNKELANRIDDLHLGSDKGYGTEEVDTKHEHANGEIGRSMVFRPMVRDRHGRKWIISDNHNAFTKEEAHGMHNYWMHNMGLDNEGKLKIYDFMERKVKED